MAAAKSTSDTEYVVPRHQNERQECFFKSPPRTEYDLNFQFLGVPVRVHPMFWLVGLLLGVQGSSTRGILIWIAALFVSILIHEMGHALTIRYFGWNPHVVLYSFGGLAIYQPGFGGIQSRGGARRQSMTMAQVLISLAGPGAQLLLAACIVLVLLLSGSLAVDAMPSNPRFFLDLLIYPSLIVQFVRLQGEPLAYDAPLAELLSYMMFINIYWALFNLMPIYPLDGGKIARELMLVGSRDGLRQSLILSFVTAAVLALYALVVRQSPLMAIMLGYLAYMSYSQLNGPFGGYGSFGPRRW